MLTKAIKERSILQNLPVTPDWLSEQDLCYTSAKTPNRIKANKLNQSEQIESKQTNRIKANKSKTSHHNCSKQYDKLSKQKTFMEVKPSRFNFCFSF